MDDASLLLTINEAASLARVSELTIRRMIADRRLAHLRIGRAVRISRASLEAFVAEHLEPQPMGVAG